MDTLQLTKLCEGLKSYVSRKRNENPKAKVKFIVTDGMGEEITYEKEIPEYSIINDQLLNPDYIGYKVLIADLEVKKGTIKEPKKIEYPPQANAAYPQQNQQLENNTMNFLFSTIMKSNEILAQSQKENLNSYITIMQANTQAMFDRILTTSADAQKRAEDNTKHLLTMQEEKFKFELEKREALESIGKDTTTIGDILNKASGFLEKIPAPIWGGIYKKLTGQEMPAYTIPTGESNEMIDSIIAGANKISEASR